MELKTFMDAPIFIPADVPTNNPQEKGTARTGKIIEPSKTTAPTVTDTWLTREECARLLGKSVQTIKNYEDRGLLLPERAWRQDTSGREQLTVVYDPRQVAQLAEVNSTRSKQEGIDTSGWVTRNECIESMNIARQTLKNYEQQGRLHPLRVPRRDARGHEQLVVVYNPKELGKLPRGVGRAFTPREAGEMEAQCCQLFEEGKPVREIVVQMRWTFDRVRELRDKWLDEGGGDIVINPEAKETLEALLGPFKDVAGLIDLVKAKLQPETKPGI